MTTRDVGSGTGHLPPPHPNIQKCCLLTVLITFSIWWIISIEASYYQLSFSKVLKLVSGSKWGFYYQYCLTVLQAFPSSPEASLPPTSQSTYNVSPTFQSSNFPIHSYTCSYVDREDIMILLLDLRTFPMVFYFLDFHF
jgi:hypothetical protein